MEARKLKIQFRRAGSGSTSTNLSVPKMWVDALNINKEDREVIAIFDHDGEEGRIIIRKMKEREAGLSNEEITAAIENINASMAIEGFELTKEDHNDMRSILSGEVDADNLISDIIEKYKDRGL